jgi:HD-GYP domain-containing protein (c-di-GMP phosphodiesterase class II)
MRIIAVADIFDALTAKRPYRDGMPLDKAFELMQKDANRAIDAVCLEALMTHHASASSPSPAVSTSDLLGLSAGIGRNGVHIPSEANHASQVPVN